jgi:PAS domain S-box-containing protein
MLCVRFVRFPCNCSFVRKIQAAPTFISFSADVEGSPMNRRLDNTAHAKASYDLTQLRSEYEDGYQSLFEQSGICMVNLDAELRLREANADFLAHFGHRPQDSYGRPFLTLLHSSVRERVSRELGLLSGGHRECYSGRIVAIRQDGALVVGELTAIAVSSPTGKVDTVLVLMTPKSYPGDTHGVLNRKMLLTPLDARILEGVAAGVSTVKLASSLFMSRGGVEYRVTALLRTLKVPNRPALVSRAHSMGMFNVDSWPPKVLPEYVK